jgi:hypothetical protein
MSSVGAPGAHPGSDTRVVRQARIGGGHGRGEPRIVDRRIARHEHRAQHRPRLAENRRLRDDAVGGQLGFRPLG